MKKILLALVILISSLLFVTPYGYANVDRAFWETVNYTCDTNTNIGTLWIEFGYPENKNDHPYDIRTYTINHAGWVSMGDGWKTSKLGRDSNEYYVPGCGCPTGPYPTSIVASNAYHAYYDIVGDTIPYDITNYPYVVAPYKNIWGGNISGDACFNTPPSGPGAGNFGVLNANQELRNHYIGQGCYMKTTTNLSFRPNGTGMPQTPACYPAACNPAVANGDLKTTPVTTGSCADGTAANFAPSAPDAEGKVTYSWTCQKAGGNPVSCNAYYKPVCIPSATDGCCSETRVNPNANGDTKLMTELPQCQYSVLLNNPSYALVGGIMPTQDGTAVLGISSTRNCRPPVDGKPQITCDTDPWTKITGSLSSFTLPSSVTKRSSTCTIDFRAADVCRPRSDSIIVRAQPCDITITDRAHPLYCGTTPVCNPATDPTCCDPATDPTCTKTPESPCDPIIMDPTHPNYCPRTIDPRNVCLKLTDKFGGPVYNFATNKITSVLGKVISNEYYEKHNNGKDPTVYAPGTFTVVGNNYCVDICTMVGTTKCCPDSVNPICKRPEPPILCDKTITDKTHPLYCPRVDTCIKTPTETCCKPTQANNYCETTPTSSCDSTITDKTKIGYCCDSSITDKNNPRYCEQAVTTSTCIATETNNYCNPIGTPQTTPGCELPGGEECIIIQKRKACTGYLEVWNGTQWTRDGESILYDEPNAYRIVINDTDPVCRGGFASIQTIGATGGVLTGSISYGDGGIFRTTITKSPLDTPKTQRGVTVQALFTQPGGLTYGLTESASDFSDTPLIITGNRMKGVRIIGNSAGTTVTNFNLNNAGVIGEQTGPATVAARNAMIKNAALLTRGIQYSNLADARTINGILYVEGDFNYSQLATKGFKTLILKGNLTLDANIPDGSNVGIIVLSKDTGTDGNIIVGDAVTFVHALVFAEGTFRGTSTDADLLNPKIQLVLKGSLFSRNTIGGSADPSNLYLAGGARTNDRDTAFIQDLNTVRNGNGDALYKNYKDPFIIDFDNMQAAPPPGFTFGL